MNTRSRRSGAVTAPKRPEHAACSTLSLEPPSHMAFQPDVPIKNQLLIRLYVRKEDQVVFAVLDRHVSHERKAAAGTVCGAALPTTWEQFQGEVSTMSAWVRRYYADGDWKKNAAAFRVDKGWVNIDRDVELRAYVNGFISAQRTDDASTQTAALVPVSRFLEHTEADLASAREAGHLVAGVDKGGYGEISVWTMEGVGRVAVKTFSKRLSEQHVRQSIATNLCAGLQYSHPSLLPLRGLVRGADGEVRHLLFDYVPGGSLHAASRPPQGGQPAMRLAACFAVLADAAAGCAYLHTRGQVHRDVKPANILVDCDRGILADYDLLVQADMASGQVGTPGYRPPEGERAGLKHGFGFDYFSFGASVLDLLNGGTAAGDRATTAGLKPDPRGMGLCAQRSVLQRFYPGATDLPARVVRAVEETVELALLAMAEKPGDRLLSIREATMARAIADGGGRRDNGTVLRAFAERLREIWERP